MSAFALKAGKLVQVAYIVENLEDSVQNFARELNLGGWVIVENLNFSELTYRGQPVKFKTSAALAYSGEMMYELIQQHDDTPSAFTEVINSTGYGFHHLAMAVTSLDESIRKYEARGYEMITMMATGGGRGAYIDTRRTLPGFLELLEISDMINGLFGLAYERACDLPFAGPTIHRL